jgi:hypothetical protein
MTGHNQTGLVGLVAAMLGGTVYLTDQASVPFSCSGYRFLVTYHSRPLLNIMRENVEINKLSSLCVVTELNWSALYSCNGVRGRLNQACGILGASPYLQRSLGQTLSSQRIVYILNLPSPSLSKPYVILSTRIPKSCFATKRDARCGKTRYCRLD